MYSRRLKIEEARNKRKAFIFILLTLVGVILLFFYGIPSIAKLTAILMEFRKGSEPPISEDTTPPPPPYFTSIPKATNNPKLEIEGTAEPGVSVIVDVNGEETEVLADNNGSFTFSFNLREGENSFFAYSRDTAGNKSQKTSVYKITYDREPPLVEIIKPQDGQEFFGSKQRQILIEGKTEKNARVQINNRFIVVDSEGNFSLATTLSEGENKFLVKAEDEAGNKTEKSLTLNFTP